MPSTTDELLFLLDLETIDDNLFRGSQLPSQLPRVYGGQVAAQAVVAAARTVGEGFAIHSLHSYFLQPGDTGAPIIYDVEKLRDGRSFTTRRVLARQHGRPIFVMTVDLAREEESWDHQDVMPVGVPGPEECPDPRDAAPPGKRFTDWDVSEIRYAGSSADVLPPDPERPGRQRVWLRVGRDLPSDPLLQAAAFVYGSDMALLGPAFAPHGLRFGDNRSMAASLDHAVWFHRPFRADDWWLYDQHSPSMAGARALINARVFTQDGRLVASVAQEALIRRRDPAREH
ncbi:acyl-CoA thioesterase II [Nocardioides sp. GY 10127]|uniref:acyl-CoA thioesterase n=1 Tax=Nocardioides sp. GY 10127 TaxID=2569762 RepID=UPI0010A81BDF|nr:acyl-CoA thioesterase II [Nocardioides sp. GY 10127]TIC86592.1 acyl-CoA thioesterase II [Nocardioides sp. GY 10127]